MRQLFRVGIPLGLVILLVIVVMSPLIGQDETILTIAAPQWMNDVFDDELFADFEAENPGVKIVTVPNENDFYGNAAFELEEYLNRAETYTSTADVLYVSSWNINTEVTRAGYFLDLSPIAQGDASLDEADFIPGALEAFRWDGGLWAIPVTTNVELVIYDRNAFDEAGLTYPSESWTLDDFTNAGLELTQYDEEGNVTVPGFSSFNPGLLFYSLLGEGFYDMTQQPNPPDFSNPELAEMVEQWAEFTDEVGFPSGGINFNEIPLAIDQTWRLNNNFGDETDAEWEAALLPGGRVGLRGEAFAVSGGTENPELAYELVKYLTRQPEVTTRFSGTPARTSMDGVEPEDSDTFFFGPDLDEATEALIERGMMNPVPYSELRYSDYINFALGQIRSEDADPQVALEEAEAQAVENLQAAEARGQDTVVSVATPVPTPVVGDDQIVMTFTVNAFSSDLPNRDAWERAVEDFLAMNPRVGNIDLQTQFFSQEDLAEIDCYFTGSNPIPFEQFDTTQYLNLDPFMDADPDFDQNDFIGDVLGQVQRNNRTWAYPIILQPSILWYNSAQFEDAGLIEPEGGWTTEMFDDSLQRLADLPDLVDAPFVPQTFGNSYIFLLIAAYGGMPYDYSTDPPTVNLADPTNIDAIREVLDLAKEGYIDYQALDTNGGSFGGGSTGIPIATDVLSSSSFRIQQRTEDESFYADYRVTGYPAGSQYTPVSYSTGVAVIGAEAQDPQACYEWIKMISERPELFTGMPTRYSALENPDLMTTQGEDLVALYRDIAQNLDVANAASFPGPFGGGGIAQGAWLEPTWINRAFDNYVLENGDLEAELTQAQENITAFRECASQIEEIDLTQLSEMDQEETLAYFRQYVDCAVAITPELRERYSFYYQEDED